MHGDDVVRVAHVVFDLVAQFGDVHVNGARQGKAVVAPDGVEQLVARDDFAPMLKKISEDAELARGKFQRLAALSRFEVAEVERDVSKLRFIEALIMLGRAAQNRFDTRHQFQETERLGNVIIRPRAESDDFVYLLPARREHDDGSLVTALAQTLAD